MKAIWGLLFAWLPAWVQVAILALFAIALVIVIFRIVALVLDSIPFL